jgi:hypothetical protein
MPQIIASFDPSAQTSGTFPLSNLSNGIGKILVKLEANWSIKLELPDRSVDVASAWTESLFNCTGPQGQVTWSQYMQLVSNSPPQSMCTIIGYDNNEVVPGTYPLALVRQANLGNPIAVATAATSVQNDGNIAGSSVLESTVTGQVSSNQTWTNDSQVNLSLIIGGIFVQWLKTQNIDPLVQLGAMSHLVQILGSLTVNQNLTVTGNSTIGGTLTAGTFAPSSINTPGGVTVGGNLTVNGTSHQTGAIDIYAGLISHAGDIQAYNGAGFNSTVGSINAGGDSNSLGTTTFTNGTAIIGGDHEFNGHHALDVGQLKFNNGNLISGINCGKFTPGGVSGTINHGLVGTPDAVMISCAQNGSTATCSASNYTSTQFSYNVFTSGIAYAWLAMKF